MIDLTKLNESQLKAVKKINGAVSVLAGAGTGKTRTLTYRIAYMIFEGIKPSEIVAVTFTNKAANEMKERVINIVGPRAGEISISTFHSFCARFLRSEIEKLNENYTHRFLIIDEDDAKQIIRDTVKELNYDSNYYNSNRLKNIFSKYKNKQIDMLDYEELHIYNNYNKYLKDNNSLDFDDLIHKTVKLLNEDEELREYYNNRYKYLLIDEFQDTNVIQYELIKLLTGKNHNVFIVGDPDQSIYAFRGANYYNQTRFIDEYNPEIIILEENYRSTLNILNAANKLISKNKNRIGEKDLTSDLGEGSPIIVEARQSDRDEAHFVTRAIEIFVGGGYEYKDIAVLYRSNSLSRIFEEAFLKASVPYVIYGGTSFFARKEIKDILSYIRLILNPHDNISLKRIINTPRRKIGQTTLGRLEAFATLYGYSLYDAIDHIDLGNAVNKRLRDFKRLIEIIKEEASKVDDLEKIIDIVNNISGYHEMLVNEGDESKDRLENILELKAIFYTARDESDKPNLEILEDLLDDLALKTNLDLDDTYNTVKLATVHQVKGLEFKIVFMVAMEEGIFPNQASMMSSFELEEERRVCYVAVTRAKERLIVSYANDRFRFGQFVSLDPSRYISDLQGEENKQEVKVVVKKAENLTDGDIELGNKVSHDSFGEGVVVEVGESTIKVAFNIDYGIKIFKRGHPALKKVI